MANFGKAKDYFDPQIYERMAQISANNALRQGDIRSNQSLQTAQIFANLLPQLAKLYTDYSQKKETSDYFSPKDYSIGDVPRGQQQVATDLLGKPITPTTIPQYQEQGTFDPTQDPQRLMRATIQQDNPFLQQAGQTGIQNFLMQQANWKEFSPGTVREDVGIFSPTRGQVRQAPFRPTVSKPVIKNIKSKRYNPQTKMVEELNYTSTDGVLGEPEVIGAVPYKDPLDILKVNIFDRNYRAKNDEERKDIAIIASYKDDIQKAQSEKVKYDYAATQGDAAAITGVNAYQKIIDERNNSIDAIVRKYKGWMQPEVYRGNAPQPPAQTQTKTDTGKIKVKRKSDGKTGTMDAKDFDASKYEKQ